MLKIKELMVGRLPFFWNASFSGANCEFQGLVFRRFNSWILGLAQSLRYPYKQLKIASSRTERIFQSLAAYCNHCMCIYFYSHKYERVYIIPDHLQNGFWMVAFLSSFFFGVKENINNLCFLTKKISDISWVPMLCHSPCTVVSGIWQGAAGKVWKVKVYAWDGCKWFKHQSVIVKIVNFFESCCCCCCYHADKFCFHILYIPDGMWGGLISDAYIYTSINTSPSSSWSQ